MINKILILLTIIMYCALSLSCDPALGKLAGPSSTGGGNNGSGGGGNRPNPPSGLSIPISNLPTSLAQSGFLVYTLVPNTWLVKTLEAMPDGGLFDAGDLLPYVHAGIIPHLTDASFELSFGAGDSSYTLYIEDMSIWQNGVEVGFLERAGALSEARDFANWTPADYEVVVHNAQAAINIFENVPHITSGDHFYVVWTLMVVQTNGQVVIKYLNFDQLSNFTYVLS